MNNPDELLNEMFDGFLLTVSDPVQFTVLTLGLFTLFMLIAVGAFPGPREDAD